MDDAIQLSFPLLAAVALFVKFVFWLSSPDPAVHSLLSSHYHKKGHLATSLEGLNKLGNRITQTKKSK
jgi:hypothetical protein